ncbi:hypothetical protein T484DRAFT_1840571, partial [Baffinella frigidus]
VLGRDWTRSFRLAAALALHPRVGFASPLAALDAELLRTVLDAALPIAGTGTA